MQIREIVEKINSLKGDLTYWEALLHEVQNDCQHDYVKVDYYKTCLKCQKTESLYY
ncbi:serine protease [Halalkalibacter krulwichiae]|uniref:Uncharacterized protein n=1 Tax=Halalkalibacter krulwichiae TaxID=199441 RepID=A0A1X9MJ62_9BACI|nr:serine protease [Halalkalibacter krulwichiae]ARK30642.1 hypothetical protein BkAM31D_12835 [Halalkalibacter krulwichiae]